MAKKKRSEKERRYSYNDSEYSGKGILATALGCISLLIFIILTGVAMSTKGEGGPWVGSIGFTGFVLAFWGMVRGLQSFHDQCDSYLFCKIGTLLSGFMVAIWFLVFCVGLAI